MSCSTGEKLGFPPHSVATDCYQSRAPASFRRSSGSLWLGTTTTPFHTHPSQKGYTQVPLAVNVFTYSMYRCSNDRGRTHLQLFKLCGLFPTSWTYQAQFVTSPSSFSNRCVVALNETVCFQRRKCVGIVSCDIQ